MRTQLTHSNHLSLKSLAIAILALLMAPLNSYAASGDTLLVQKFDTATAVAYAANTAVALTSSNSNICGTNAYSQFTTITSNAKGSCAIGVNSTTGGNSKSYAGKFGAYYNNTGGYWSICKTSNFATTAPKAIKVEMNALFHHVSSGGNIGVQFAVGSGFSSGLTNSCPALTACVAGFALPSNSTLRIAKYATSNGNTAINGSSSPLTAGSELKYTWVINNTDETLTYKGPDNNNTTLAAGCWDLWVGTTRNLAGVTKATTGMSGTTIQNLYIGSPHGKKHEFILNDIAVIDLTPATCSTSITPSLSYAPASILIGESATPSVNGNPGSGAVSYAITSATPAGCASINTSTGVVTGVAEGSVTVTATVAESGDYCSGSTTATVEITSIPCVAPSSVSISGTQNYTEGQTISLSATPTGGTGTPSYQWFKHSTDAGDAISGAISSTYTKASCVPEDAAAYYCRVSTGSGCETFSAPYGVSVAALPTSNPPTITTQPVSASYEVGETIIPLEVEATGSGTLTYQWTKDDVNISGATSSTYTPDASGSYRCIVTNTDPGSKPQSVMSGAADIAIQSNTYYLQGISGTSGTGTFTGDFFTTAPLTKTVTATYDGVSYTKGVAFGGNVTSWSNGSYSDRLIRYDCKTTHTEFKIIVYNSNNSAKNVSIGHIIENEIGSANTVSTLTTDNSAASKTQTVFTYTIDNSAIKPRSLYVGVSSTDVGVVQIIAEETGTKLITPGSVGYKLNFNLLRPDMRPGVIGWIDDPDYVICSNSNVTAGTDTYFKIQNKGTNYFKFRTDKAATVKIGVNSNSAFFVADNQSGTSNVTAFPKRKNATDTIYSVVVDAGIHYLVPSGSNVQVRSFEIAPAIRINYNANGGSGTMKSQVVSPGEVELNYNMFLRPGYSFRGWCENPDGSGTITRDGGIRTIADSPDELTLYAIWIEPCSAVPVLKQKTSYITIKDGQYVDMALYDIECDFDTTGIHYSVQSATPAIPGCTFEYYDDQLHIWGTPSIGNASLQTFNVTIVMTNDCSPATTFSMTQEIRVNPASRKEKIAFIIDGTENNNVFPIASSSKGSALVTYLRQFYDVDYVNGYATKDEEAIANFYKDYDLLIVTDYLETPKGYTNAIGTLIDQKPILSFEAYVAGENGSNWHINSTPADPSPKTGVMKVLCSGHAIFKNAEGVTVLNPDTTINVLASISGKGLQGFVINEAPDFAFIATARDANNNRDLIVCCERQVVFQARLLMYCINFNDMGNLSDAGRVVMHQMIDYLLMTDETKVADCSLVFDNGAGNIDYDEAVYHASGGTGYKGDGLWSTAANWKPGYNIVPTPYHGARIVAECHVDAPNAHAGGVKINYGRDENGQLIHGKLIIEPTGGLLVAGMVKAVNDTRYASPLITKPEDLIIQADADHNGALVFGEKTSDVQATVQYYSRGRDATSANPVWQYMGIPLQARQTAMSMFYESWMCQWTNEADGSLGGKWKWVDNYDILMPFEGYCITQESAKTFTFKGRLNQPISRTLQLDAVDDDGFAIVSNSWTAPIKIQELETTDFVNAEAAIYIYHTGTYADWSSAGDPVSAKTAVATNPGQYAVIPVHSSPYLAGADSVIPAMQGFGVHTTDDGASLTLNYGKVVYDAKNFTTSTQPMRAPSRRNITAEQTDKPDVMTMSLSGTANGDLVYILSRADFTDGFENGWDGRKIPGDAAAPMLAVVKEGGDMAVAAVPTLEERYLTFRAGADSVYTFSFNYDGEPIYLYDQVTRQATLINSANTYTFTANNKTAAQRFLITKNPPLMPTDLEMVETDGLFHFENYARQAIEVRIFDVQGRVVYTLNTNDEIVDIAPALPVGVYMARIKAGDTVKVVKLIGKEGAL